LAIVNILYIIYIFEFWLMQVLPPHWDSSRIWS